MVGRELRNPWLKYKKNPAFLKEGGVYITAYYLSKYIMRGPRATSEDAQDGAWLR